MVRSVKFIVYTGDDFVQRLALVVKFIRIKYFVETNTAFCTMFASVTGEQVFVIMFFFAVAVTKLAIEYFGNFLGNSVSLRNFSREDSRGEYRPCFY